MITINSKNSHDINVSVIIPSYNSHKTIGKTLEGIISQTAVGAIREIIVVDSSDDNISHEFLKEQENDLIKIVRSGYRIMPAVQRNIGGKMAKGDLLCFIDSDAFPREDWIEKIVIEYKHGYMVGGGSYAVPDFQRKMPIAYAQYFLEFSEYIGYGKKRVHDIVASCNLFCDRELFLRVGGFPEVRASEDSLFCLKVNREERLIFIPDAVVYHIFRENSEHFLSNQKMLGKYIYLFRKKSYNSFYYRGIMPYIFYPAFLTFKFLRIFFRVLRTNPDKVWKFIIALPLLIKGISHWGRGFLLGIKEFKGQDFTINN